MTVLPYSGCAPAKKTVPPAGARTGVRGWALMSRPLWNSVTRVQGETRLPNSEFTPPRTGQRDGDRKSTRLNSSHSQISYAVFCLKKKKKKKIAKKLERRESRTRSDDPIGDE